MTERKKIFLNNSKIEVLDVNVTGVSVSRETLTRPEGEQVLLNTIRVDKESSAQLIIDPKFLDKPIVFEPGSSLINQKATTAVWGEPAGQKPETFISNIPVPKDSILLPTTNVGWQQGAFWVKDGQVKSLVDDPALNRPFEVFGKSESGWGVREVNIQNGKVSPNTKYSNDLSGMELGFSAPQILRNGEIVSADTILARRDPRLTADPRNVYDWTANANFTNLTQKEFLIGFMRRVDPTPIAVNRLNRGVTSTSVVHISAADEEVDKLNETITDGGLNWTAQKAHTNPHGKKVSARIAIPGPISPNRLPLIVFGNDGNGNLIALTADGRQPGSTGLTIDEAAEKIRDKGAINAVLGAAGGDIFVGLKKGNNFTILNSPSNIDRYSGQRVTRRIPSMLVIG